MSRSIHVSSLRLTRPSAWGVSRGVGGGFGFGLWPISFSFRCGPLYRLEFYFGLYVFSLGFSPVCNRLWAFNEILIWEKKKKKKNVDKKKDRSQ